MFNIFFGLNRKKDLYHKANLSIYLNKKYIKHNIDCLYFDSYTYFDREFNYYNIQQILLNYINNDNLLKNLKLSKQKLNILNNNINSLNSLNGYDLYCFSIFDFYFPDYLIYILTLKRRNINNILIGGPNIILNEYMLKFAKQFDLYYSFGDLEESVVKFISNKQFNLTSYIDLNSLSIYDVPSYTKEELDFLDNRIELSTSRGCPKKCYYCNSYSLSPYRKINMDIIIEWFKYFNKIGIKEVGLIDPNISVNNFDYFIHNLNKIDNKCELDRLFLDINSIDIELVKKFNNKYIKEVAINLECIHPTLQKNFNKKYKSLEYIRNIIKILTDKNIKIIIFYIYGFPTQTKEIFSFELDFLLSLQNNNPRYLISFEVYRYDMTPKSYIHLNNIFSLSMYYFKNKNNSLCNFDFLNYFPCSFDSNINNDYFIQNINAYLINI